jgi:secreted protein with Ig-like and vWFA domain
MNTPNESENKQAFTTDDLHDRLIDVALREVAGNVTPPDLSARILAANINLAAATVGAASRAAPPSPSTRKRAFWAALAVAAMLLVGISIALLPALQSPQQSSRSSVASRLGNESSQQLAISQEKSTLTSNAMPSPSYSTTDSYDSINHFAEGAERDAGAYGSYAGDSVQAAAPVADGREWAESSAIEREDAPLVQPDTKQLARGEVEVRFQKSDSTTFKVESAPDTPQQYLQLYSKKDAGLRGFNFGEAQVPTGGYGGRALTPEGTGPGLSGDQYTRIFENPFIKAEGGDAVSTFSIDVDTASYANVRQFIMEMNTMPPPDAVRVEELINYFDYDYAGPNSDAEEPFAAHVEVAGCPWNSEHRLVRIGIKGREMERTKRPRSNLVFLVDVSGSMDEPNKLPLVAYGLQQLTRELGENDRVAIVVYASSDGLVLPSTPGSDQATILAALGRLQAGGSTAGGAGIQLAYQIAEDHFIESGTNRVVLCTDGDFNVGVTSTAELERLCEQKAKDTRVFLSVLGFGRGNLNDAMMEAISNRGNGNYHYVDNRTEARRVLVEEMTGTLVTIAKDVKIQVEFNPRQVAGYRLIGYENRMLRTEDFNDDTKDAGEIGAGHTVTALYEVVPAGKPIATPPVDGLKYQQQASAQSSDNVHADGEASDASGEMLTLKMRYKQPEGDTSRKLEWAVTDHGKVFAAAASDFQFAAAVAGFGLVLRDSQHKGNLTLAAVLELAQSAQGEDEHGYRAEFLDIVRRAKSLRGE